MKSSESVSNSVLVKLDEALGRLGGDYSLFREFVSIYFEDSPSMIAQIVSAADSKDAIKLERAAHALKGLVLNFGATEFVELVREIEQAGKTGAPDGAIKVLHRLALLHKQLCDELEKFR